MHATMVDGGTWSKLTPAEQSEYSAVHEQFVRSVQNSGTYDGYHFGRVYAVYKRDGRFFLGKTAADDPFAGITSRSRAVIYALLTDAVQNYGR